MEENGSKKIKKPWPTKDAMLQIYELNLWGGDSTNFYSGIGSHHPELINPYIEVVTSFLTSFESPIVVCDLGCGDFNVGKELVKHAKKFIAVDIVPDLIANNRIKFNLLEKDKTKRVQKGYIPLFFQISQFHCSVFSHTY